MSSLGGTPLFAGLGADALAALESRAVRRRYRAGSVVFCQGEPGTRCYAIMSGAVKVSAFNPDGKEAVLAVLGPGDVFGELALFDEAPRSADALVIETAELLSLDRDDVTAAIEQYPQVSLALLRILSRRLRRANEALQDAAFFDVAGRVARRLADLADEHGAPGPEGTAITVPISQESLASMVGATRESVNKALANLGRRGLVSRRGRSYVVPDTQALRSRAR
ncbi:MAG TPA: Crp/Fnr family transcriptional regulator [Actinomycetota bacterium]|nr:Crp/Fnr family transcriptional regulator [Actinomycetota bacterium]